MPRTKTLWTNPKLLTQGAALAAEKGYAFVPDALRTRIAGMCYRIPELGRWQPTEIGYQVYGGPDAHISEHRDRISDQLLAATVSVEDAATIGIHEEYGDEDIVYSRQIDEIVARPGMVMFLRASGLGNGERALHSVGPPLDGHRAVLNLRMRPDVLV
jgi:hypothetical protein